jgi:hypothetical protein
MMQYNRSMKQSERLEIRVDPDVISRLRAAALDEGRSVSNLARRLLDRGLAAEPVDEKEESE